MSEDQDKKTGRFVKGNTASKGRPKEKRGGLPKKADDRFSKKFLEDVLMRKYGGTALGAVSAIEDLLSSLSEKDQVTVHLRLLELGVKIVPRELRTDNQVKVEMILKNVERPWCPRCGYHRDDKDKPVDVTPTAEANPPSWHL